jgi:ribosomal protein L7/L12
MERLIQDDKLTGVKNALFQGQKIQAIKLHRKSTGSGLAEAKDAIEKLEAQLRSKSPEEFVNAPVAKGCSTGIALVCVMVAAVVGWLLRR